MYRSDTITLNRSKYVVNSPKTKRKAEIIAFISEIDKISKPDSDFYPKFIYNMLVSSEKANMIFNNLIYMQSNGFLLQKTACCGPQTLKKYALIQDIFQCSFSMNNLLIIVTFDQLFQQPFTLSVYQQYLFGLVATLPHVDCNVGIWWYLNCFLTMLLLKLDWIYSSVLMFVGFSFNVKLFESQAKIK